MALLALAAAPIGKRRDHHGPTCLGSCPHPPYHAFRRGQGRVLFTCLYANLLLLFIVLHLMSKLGKL